MWPFEHAVLRHITHLLPNLISSCTTKTAFLPPFHRSHKRKIQPSMGTSTAPPLPSIPTIVEELQNAFDHGKTRPLEWRTKQMRQLWALIDVSHTGTSGTLPLTRRRRMNMLYNRPSMQMSASPSWTPKSTSLAASRMRSVYSVCP